MAAQQGEDLIGRTLGRTYQVERLLGGGGMGAVYAARHVRTGGLFALKILHRETAADADIYKRFQDEARTVSALRHPHIVQVTDFDKDEDGTPFIVMELLEGEDLYARLCRVGRLPVEAVLDIGRQVGSALHAAHDKGIIHRDIKPQNIFLVRHEVAEMVTEVAKVVDFGISKIRRTGQQMTRDMTILGTPQFMSPEAALGQNSQLDGRADQWSLAVIMYLALTGQLPFDGENLVGVLYKVVHEQPVPLRQLAPEVPETLVVAIERAMSKRKDDRFPRMVDFVRAMTGLGMTVAASMRMPSAVLRAVPASDIGQQTQIAAEAPTQAPHLQNQVQTARTVTPLPPAADAPTRMPHLQQGGSAGEQPLTRPLLPPPESELQGLTVPAVAPMPEMVATPSSPTAYGPMASAQQPAVSRLMGPHSGDTPTNISMTDSDLKALLAAERQDHTPLTVPPPKDLPGEPTRVAGKNGASTSSTVALAPRTVGPTMPLSVLRVPASDQNGPRDYASTLSRATGQEMSLPARALPPYLQWPVVRDFALQLCGVVPRSNVRLAATGGVLTLLLAVMVLWLASGPSAPSQSARGGDKQVPQSQDRDPPPPVTTQARDGGLLADPSGSSPTVNSDDKGATSKDDGKLGTKTAGKPVTPTLVKKPVIKTPEDSRKRIKIDPGV